MRDNAVGERHAVAVHGVKGIVDLVLAVIVDEDADAIHGLMEIGAIGDVHQGDDLGVAVRQLLFGSPIAHRSNARRGRAALR